MEKLRYTVAAATLFAPVIVGATNVGALSFVGGESMVSENTITLSSNVASCLTIDEGETYTLDLNDHTLKNGVTGCSAIWNKGTLTITGNGMISQITGSSVPLIANEGTLVIDGTMGTSIEGATELVSSDAYAPVVQNTKGTTTINGGFFSASNTATNKMSAVVLNQAGTTTINGGSFIQNGPYNAIQADVAGGVINIKDGNFSNTATGNNSGVVGTTATNATINIYGGNFMAPGVDNNILYYNGNGTFTISGGYFNTGEMYTPTAFVTGGTWANRLPANGEVSAVVKGYKGVETESGYEIVKDETLSEEPTSEEPTSEEPSTPASTAVALKTVKLSKEKIELNKGGSVKLGVTYGPEDFDVKNVSNIRSMVKGYDYSQTNEKSPIAYCYGMPAEGETAMGLGYELDATKVACEGYESGEGTLVLTFYDESGNSATTELQVVVENALESGSDGVYDSETGAYVSTQAEFKTPIEGADHLEVKVKDLPEAQADNKELKLVVDIKVYDENGEVVPVKDNEITVTIYVNEEMLGGEYEHFQIVYLDENGEAKEWFDPISVEKDEYGGYTITFKTTHFSQYGVLASNTEFASAEILNKIKAPDTGAAESVSYLSNSAVLAVVLAGAAVALAGAAIFAKR